MRIVVTDQKGETRELEALDGWRVMEIIRDWGLPIKAECGGACSCATCHVYVEEAWLDRLVPPTEEEIEMLDGAFEVEDNSRLSCQILMRPDLDGLAVTLAPGTEPD
ncbi:MAG: 2Fe-2S iron-sulfur cluster-binding protein [Azospirillaceae bacterium]